MFQEIEKWVAVTQLLSSERQPRTKTKYKLLKLGDDLYERGDHTLLGGWTRRDCREQRMNQTGNGAVGQLAVT